MMPRSLMPRSLISRTLPRATGRYPRSPWRGLVFSGAFTLLVLPTASWAETFADSEADWSVSGTQGERGWCAGYYNFTFDDGTYAPEDFVPFSEEHWDGASSAWRLQRMDRGIRQNLSRAE